MLIEFLSAFHVILCFSLIIIIYFARPDTSGLSTLSQSFNQNNGHKLIRFRPVTKVIFSLVALFFINSIVLNKLIAKQAKNSSVIENIIKSNESNGDVSGVATENTTKDIANISPENQSKE